jgi:hypothetical protein
MLKRWTGSLKLIVDNLQYFKGVTTTTFLSFSVSSGTILLAIEKSVKSSELRLLHSKFTPVHALQSLFILSWVLYYLKYCSFRKTELAYMLNLICYIYTTRDCPSPNSLHFFLTTGTQLKIVCSQ